LRAFGDQAAIVLPIVVWIGLEALQWRLIKANQMFRAQMLIHYQHPLA
jgi:hypothetical protein